MFSLEGDDDLVKRLVTDNQDGITNVCPAVRRTSQAAAPPKYWAGPVRRLSTSAKSSYCGAQYSTLRRALSYLFVCNVSLLEQRF
jgi:hypothetical protein